MIITNEVEVLQTPPQSPSDRKEYKLIKLLNGLKALLVKTPEIERTEDDTMTKDNTSAVALCIDVGSFDDPREVQGLCHFLEHMVFMGSEKFPQENEFDQFVKNRNGVDNAMTECEHTIFYFRIGEDHLAGALDRFSQFFISPLMLPESMEREMESVESEFQNSVNDDVFRINQLFASMAHEYHSASNFTWGSLKTLSEGIRSEDLYRIVHEFRRKLYKSNRMNLCIQSSLDLEVQEKMVVEYFNEIQPEHGTMMKKTTVDPFVDVFKTEFYKKMFFVKSKTQKRKMFLTFLLPTMEIDYKNKSLEYLAYLFNYQGRESLSSYFKRKSLALQIVAKVGSRCFEGNSMFTFFTVEVNLTREGYEDMATVLDAIFSYLFIIKMTPVDEHKEIFDEFKEIKETLFNYRKEKTSMENVEELALNMRFFKDEDIIVGKEICAAFDEFALKKLIERINERKFNLMILSDKHQNYDKVEKWFGTEYAEVDFPSKFIQLWNERWIRKEFSLPRANRFICRNFHIFSAPSDDEPDAPLMNDFCKCFYMQDEKFKLPHGFIYLHFKSSLTESSVSNLNMTSIYSMCIKNFLSEKLFPATIAGYSYKLNSVDDGLVLKLSGFNEKLPSILDLVTKAMKNVDHCIDNSVFEIFKKELKKNCYNYIVNSNLFNEELRLNLIKPKHKFYFDRFKDVDSINYLDFKQFLMRFIKSLRIKILIQGNFPKYQAMDITQHIIKNLSEERLKINTKPVNAHQLPIGATYLRVKSLLPNDQNSVIKNYYQIGVCTTESECLLELLVKLMREPLFNFIRTKEQLGYSVSCSSKKDDNVLGLTITVESQEKRNSSWIVDTKIESFLKGFPAILTKLKEDDFEILKQSIVAQKRSADIDLETEVNRNWNEIREGKYQFERNDIDARQLEILKKADLIIFFKDHFSPVNAKKLSVQVIANADDTNTMLHHGFLHLDLLSDDQLNTIKNIAQFKSCLSACS